MGTITSAARIWLTRSFQPFLFKNTYSNNLEYQNVEKPGLYIHIPFCRTICDFCPYCKVLYDERMAEQYINALLKEIDMVGNMRGNERKEVSSLYFGGGSPALLASNIKRIVGRINRHFIITDGIGLELHPYDVTEENLSILKEAGVTKISIGVQSFQPEYLHILGRSEFDSRAMFGALSKVPFETVSMDFIFTLPGQTIELLKKDIESAFSSGANHIAVYPFIDFTFTNRNFTKMNNGEKKKLLYELVAYCESKGYVRDSIWTFSRHGTAKYSSMTRDNFIGFGCSATTLLKDIFKINTFDIPQYIKRVEGNELPTALTLQFTRRQRMVYYLFWTAYSMTVNSDAFKDFFSKSLENCYGFELLLARIAGLIRKEKNEYVMTTRGAYYYHYFEHFYTLSYIDKMWNLMKNDAFPKVLTIR